jgi:mono/diheme cytochrome c family protein
MSNFARLIPWLGITFAALTSVGPTVSHAAETKPEEIEFFESKVRPLLVEHCYECHSAQSKVLKGNLRLDSRAAALVGGDSGVALVPGKPDDSNLVQALRWESSEMPPSGKLPEEQIATIVKWVKLGAPWPDDGNAPPPAIGKTYDWPVLRESHWAWKPVQRAPLPKVANAKWPQNEIDRFVLAKLEAAGLEPSPPAEAGVLIRRLSLDLIGLPPTPEQIERFVRAAKKNRKAAIEDLVDELLASPHYGERWGRHWLDVARYSDGYGGFLDSKAMTSAWRYRDWVVNALNRDLPYDEFVKLQITGDLVSNDDAVATGFLALGPTYISDGGDAEATAQAKAETLDDRVDTVTRGLMAMTVSCARCHDHRFDPYPQLDYYSLAGVFNNTSIRELPLAEPEEVKAYKEYLDKTSKAEKKYKDLGRPAKAEGRELTKEEKTAIAEARAIYEELKANTPKKYEFIHALDDTGNSDMHLAIRGNLMKPGELAPRRFLRIIAGPDPTPFHHGSGRIDLAAAVVDPTNPLTPRVIVNRVWQNHFGEALVRTPSNFGMLGEKPSHPELLDWLASKLVGDTEDDFRWSLKRLHRAIVLSATYQQSSEANEQAATVDGDNRLLWRMNPRRLDVEAWRDSLLASTGELDSKLGGKSIDDITSSSRRTLYASISRNGDRFDSDTFLRTFDFPAPRATSEGRTSSVVPQQSLFFMNSPFMAARAKKLAERLADEADNDKSRIKRAYLLLYGRPASNEEIKLGTKFLAAGKKAETDKSKESEDNDRLTAWQQYAQVLLSASELMYLN